MANVCSNIISNKSDDITFWFDTESRITGGNENFMLYLGLTNNVQSIDFLQCLEDNCSKIILEAYQNTIANKSSSLQQVEFINSNGVKENYILQSFCLLDDNHIVGVRFVLSSKKDDKEDLKIESYNMCSSIEDERRNISRELHDDLGQRLTLIKYALMNDLSKEEIYALIHESLESLRNISHELSPEYIAKSNIVDLVKQLVERLNSSYGSIKFNFELEDVEPLIDSQIKLNIFRIIQENLTNILRHSLANNCLIILKREDSNINLTIVNDGLSFKYQDLIPDLNGGQGLMNIKHRVVAMEGKFEYKNIESEQGHKNQFKLSVPIEEFLVKAC